MDLSQIEEVTRVLCQLHQDILEVIHILFLNILFAYFQLPVSTFNHWRQFIIVLDHLIEPFGPLRPVVNGHSLHLNNFPLLHFLHQSYL